MYDLIIIGAGPAGISAGIYAVSRGLKTVIIEKNKVGGIIGNVSTVTHYAAIVEDETGESFAGRMKEQAENAGVEIVYETVKDVSLSGQEKKVVTEKSVYTSPRVILANGCTPNKLGIEGEAEFQGKGIGLNAPKHGPLYKGKNIYVVGGADGAVKEALYLSRFAKKLTIIHFEDRLGCISEFQKKIEKADNISLMLGARLVKVSGKDCVDELTIRYESDGHMETVTDPGCGVFVYAGSTPNTEMYQELKLENGFIPVNDKMETAIPGVYAAGDIRVKQVRQAATAVSDGAVAAVNAAMKG
ncbi:MAG: NAD(P)/FAD-dependent oxidoreductase [Lachnospiraceae bacterium]|nr:NAD(P)/FAD-dependent oxidoreductase [Butyrivibrio sp.]MCM1345285.1 NAD(P)/FAD-dependent oxidoreductase [Muribaculaceae bacterium]MCM1411820.1 NAD(P)/FAD-dependent oxidoreductase [Lachnospiraceae bacterium]